MSPSRLCAVAGLAVSLATALPARADEATTLLFVRHGEKPPDGLGQLSCRGLNRALALPAVLRRTYGHIDAVFAPNPAQPKPDGKGEDGAVLAYDYVRPLATVEPTAVAFGLPVHADLGYAQTGELAAALLAPAYRGKTVLVGWEHHALNKMVPELLRSLGGDAGAVREWTKTDFDTIWRVTITRDGGATHAAFAADREGLDGQPEACPGGG